MTDHYQTIEQAIGYLEENYKHQPGLEELAANLNMSPFHLQRIFKEWVGISPKRFLQFLTIDHARKLLRDSHNLLDVAWDSGLSGAGRLHDLFVNIEGMTPGEYKTAGAGLNIEFGFHASPFGEVLLAHTTRGICGLYFIANNNREMALSRLYANWPRAQFSENSRTSEALAKHIFYEPQNKRPINVLMKGTNFQIKVWEALLQIPLGYAFCYEDVAGLIGDTKAVRAVASAVARNPVSYLIPCHRVIRKMGRFGNYQGGTQRKKAILVWESARRFRDAG